MSGGLTIDEVTVRYDEAVVLDRFTLEVAPGEVVAVVGPSGSGKSTLLRAVAGLEPLSGGRVALAGRDLDGVPTHRRCLGLMFQDHGLFTHVDVASNVGYGLAIAGVDEGERQARVGELLALVGLDGFEGRRVDQLSGGEAQRVALARALAPAPGLLMLDEPLGSLDRALRDQLTTELRRLLADLGQTALHVTHDQGEAFALADRVAVINGGRLVAIDRPAQLWSDPGTEFVAEFLGHPNRWTATIDPAGEVRVGGLRLGVVGAGHDLRQAGSNPVRVVLPATAVELIERDNGRPEDVLAVTIDDVVFDRGVSLVTARVGPSDDGGAEPALQVDFSTPKSVEVGERCSIRFDIDRLRPLDLV